MTAILVGITCWGGMTVTACWSAEPGPRNQAGAADTLILPPEHGDEAGGGSGARLLRALRATGQTRLDHVGVVAAIVDADGCTTAPLQPRSPPANDGRPGDGVQALAQALRRKGVQVAIIPAQDILAIDNADQKRIQATKGSFNLQTFQGGGRWFATRADLVACMSGRQGRAAHAALEAVLVALRQDVIVAVEESQAESKGPHWNKVEGLMNSDGKSFYAAASSATVAATLVTRNGMMPWSGKAYARGVLRPPLDGQALGVLEAYMGGEIAKLEAYRKVHPDAGAGEPPDGLLDPSFEAVADGNLEEAPEGATLGPSAEATFQAAADRLAEQLKAVLPVR